MFIIALGEISVKVEIEKLTKFSYQILIILKGQLRKLLTIN